MHLLLVDDDPKLLSYVARGLEHSGHACTSVPDSAQALAVLRNAHEPRFDLILLDVMLPDRSGWSLLEELRGAGDGTPVIFVTARGEVDERVKGLALGADDYIIKPFAFRELLARIEAVRRRRDEAHTLRFGEVAIELASRRVVRGGAAVELTPREYDLLVTLARSLGRIFSRAELLERVWGIHFDPHTNVVEVLVARLRRKLGSSAASLIQTVVGEGYRLVPRVKDGA